MAFKLALFCKQETDTTGTGSLDLNAGGVDGRQEFAEELSNSDETVYAIFDDPANPTRWEIGRGTLTTGSPDTLSRDTVYASSNNGSKISLQSGTTYTVIGTIAPQFFGTAATKDVDSSDLGLTGEIRMWAGSGNSPPSSWLICDGQAVSRTTYADLFNVVGTVYGNGDGSTTFNLPDFRGKSPLGVNDADLSNGEDGSYSSRNEGEIGGEEEHVITQAELASHSHGTASGSHPRFLFTDTSNNSRDEVDSSGSGSLTFSNTSQTFDSSTATGDTGSDQAHNTMHPFLVVNFIIKT
jgi:microcystin-dependent protein